MDCLVEAVAAGAAAGRVRVVDREALLLDRVDEVDDGAREVGPAHPVDDDLDAGEVVELVALERALVEEQLVAQARATAGLHCHPQGEVVAALLVEEVLHLRGRGVGEEDALGGVSSGFLDGHAVRLPDRWELALGGPKRSTAPPTCVFPWSHSLTLTPVCVTRRGPPARRSPPGPRRRPPAPPEASQPHR